MVIHAPQEEEVSSLESMAEKLKDPGTYIKGIMSTSALEIAVLGREQLD